MKCNEINGTTISGSGNHVTASLQPTGRGRRQRSATASISRKGRFSVRLSPN